MKEPSLGIPNIFFNFLYFNNIKSYFTFLKKMKLEKLEKNFGIKMKIFSDPIKLRDFIL